MKRSFAVVPTATVVSAALALIATGLTVILDVRVFFTVLPDFLAVTLTRNIGWRMLCFCGF